MKSIFTRKRALIAAVSLAVVLGSVAVWAKGIHRARISPFRTRQVVQWFANAGFRCGIILDLDTFKGKEIHILEIDTNGNVETWDSRPAPEGVVLACPTAILSRSR
jgi:hypothetical protein